MVEGVAVGGTGLLRRGARAAARNAAATAATPAAAAAASAAAARSAARAARSLVARQHHHVLLRHDLVDRHGLAPVVGVGDEQQVHAVGGDVALEELVTAVGSAVLRMPALAVGAGGGLARLVLVTGLHPDARVRAG